MSEVVNPEMVKVVAPETKLKSMIVDYVGETKKPEDGNVTVEMVIDVLALEFPEFLMVVAEENWVRGYKQGLDDATGDPNVQH